MFQPNKTLIVVVGPTAIGKTELAVKLAKYYNTEIISADSRQFFAEMDIGTAKPSEEELQTVKHHFINSHSIQTEFSVGDFEKQSLQLVNNIFISRHQVVLVGGSGLYIKALCQGFDNIPKAGEGIREGLNNLFAEKGIVALQEYLKKVDPEYFGQVDINNPQRLIRALEVWETSGNSFSSYRVQNINPRPFKIITIGLTTNRDELYQRINNRVDLMMEKGLLEEVQKLLPYRNHNALNTVGYTELFEYLDGKISLEQAVDKIKQNTRRFAKRQLTWFNRQPDIKWFEPADTNNMIDYVNQQLLQNPEPGG